MPNGLKKWPRTTEEFLASVSERMPTAEEFRRYRTPPPEWKPPAAEEVGPPPKKERKYPPLPGMEFPWQVDWEALLKAPMRFLLGEAPWQPTVQREGLWAPAGVPEGPPVEWPEEAERLAWGEFLREGAPPLRRGIREYRRAFPSEEIDPTTGRLRYPPIPGLEALSEEEQEAYVRLNKPYGLAIFNTETGEKISWEEARELLRTNPDLPVTAVYPIGGTLFGEIERPLSQIVSSEEELETMARTEAEHFAAGAEGYMERVSRESMEAETSIAEGIVERLKNAFEGGQSDEYILSIRDELWSAFYKLGQTSEDYSQYLWYYDLGPPEKRANEVILSILSKMPGRLLDRYMDITGGEAWTGARGPVQPALKDRLGEFGIWVSDNPPYLSPLTEAQLMRLPPEVVAMMKSYLSEKGMSWEDYLAVATPAPVEAPVEEWGGRPIPARWGIPYQR